MTTAQESPEDVFLSKAQEVLDEVFPLPDSDLARLTRTAAHAPDEQPWIEMKRLVVEVDDLISQSRWHIGQAIYLRKRYPSLVADKMPKDDLVRHTGMPTNAALLLRPFVAHANKILYADLAQQRMGIPLAGWIFHMMIDDAIYRSMAALDRLARVISIVGGVDFKRTYFRSHQMSKLHDAVPCSETETLIAIAESDVYQLLLDYRDGFTHTRKAISNVSSVPLSHQIHLPDQKTQYESEPVWHASDLLALVNAGYKQLLDALQSVSKFCEARTPQKKSKM